MGRHDERLPAGPGRDVVAASAAAPASSAPGSSSAVTFEDAAALEHAARAALETVHDPEIPALSVVDLGIVRRVRVEAGDIVVELMPTFLGCPAIALMRDAIVGRLAALAPTRVELVRDEAWTSDRISEAGRRMLRESGFAPPPRGGLIELTPLPAAAAVECPYCSSRATALETPFGPTPCRAIYYCHACRQPFEQFKVI